MSIEYFPPQTQDVKQLAGETLVISLPERVDRRERVTKLFAEENIPFRFVDGVRVNGSEISNREISELYFASFKVAAGWDSYVRAAVGCKRAHVNCLEYAFAAGLQSVLIMEDDVGFRENWHEHFLRAQAELPEGWLQLYLSAGVFKPSEIVSRHVHRLSGACQTTAILYSRDGIEAGLKCARSARAEIDWWMGLHLHPFGCSYVVEPHATYQVGGYSDCRGTFRGETA
jgi:GR25 family glycosyltransferase involved in LPS biosynthesis